MTAEFKYGGNFEFVSVVLPVLLCNNYPNLSDLSHGMLRRAHILPFDRVFEGAERDDTLFPHIWKHELSGALNRALQGLQRLRKRGGFQTPNDCERAKDHWLAHANPLTAFIAECCEQHSSHHIGLKHFFQVFEAWAKSGGISYLPSRNTLKSNLENLGYRVRTLHGYSDVSGLSIRSAGSLLPTATSPSPHGAPIS